MLIQNLKAIGEELSEICVLFCKYIYIFIYIDVDVMYVMCFEVDNLRVSVSVARSVCGE
jgi:hypothetical protein